MLPLQGVTVIEAGAFITAPFGSMLLADLGAEIIKIERPGGDPFRRAKGDTYRPIFRAFNRSKKSVVVNIQKPEGQKIFRRLVEHADLLIENNRPGTMEKLGLGYAELSKLNSRLVYCSVTGYGATGPYRDRPAYDTVGQGMSGLLSMYVDPDDLRVAGGGIADQVTGLYACYAALSGLLQRAKTGKGCRVETSMVAAGISFCEMFFTRYFAEGEIVTMRNRSVDSLAFSLCTSDGKLLAIHLSSPPKFWESLLVAIQAPHLGTDPRFVTRPDRIENYEALRLELSAIFARHPRNHWMNVLADKGVPFSPIYGFDEVGDDPQVKHMDLFHELRHSSAAPTTMVKRAVLIDGNRGHEAASAPPLLGEHTDEILKRVGYTDSELELFQKSEIVERLA